MTRYDAIISRCFRRWRQSGPRPLEEFAMMKRLQRLSIRESLRHASEPLDFGELVAVLIVMIGLISFATAGLWAPP